MLFFFIFWIDFLMLIVFYILNGFCFYLKFYFIVWLIVMILLVIFLWSFVEYKRVGVMMFYNNFFVWFFVYISVFNLFVNFFFCLFNFMDVVFNFLCVLYFIVLGFNFKIFFFCFKKKFWFVLFLSYFFFSMLCMKVGILNILCFFFCIFLYMLFVMCMNVFKLIIFNVWNVVFFGWLISGFVIELIFLML